MLDRKIDIEKRQTPKTPLPWREGIKGRGVRKVIMHPHLSPLSSRERGSWIKSMSILGLILFRIFPVIVQYSNFV